MKYMLRIQVEIIQGDGYGSGLRISEGTEFKADSFAELCEILTKILTKYHGLAVESTRHKP